ncbi:hypothetical protein NDU88_002613 [Pleurodeles waltl]|uniref:Uncharacterized protein n=1 Tax=Pleurodeles waltl TaxID=8319 RepID=A0AAV7M3V9_PLEWA|nr:hypothetical protein NDU88_002613 [Pleurodeles waltl]
MPPRPAKVAGCRWGVRPTGNGPPGRADRELRGLRGRAACHATGGVEQTRSGAGAPKRYQGLPALPGREGRPPPHLVCAKPRQAPLEEEPKRQRGGAVHCMQWRPGGPRGAARLFLWWQPGGDLRHTDGALKRCRGLPCGSGGPCSEDVVRLRPSE